MTTVAVVTHGDDGERTGAFRICFEPPQVHALLAQGLQGLQQACAGAAEQQAAVAGSLDEGARGVASGAAATARAALSMGERARLVEHAAAEVGSSTAAQDRDNDPALAAAAVALNRIGSALRDLFNVPRGHAGRFIALLEDRQAMAGALRQQDLLALDQALRASLVQFHRALCGVSVAVAPDVLADASLWMQWWQRADGGPERLEPQLDPRRPDFYDYTKAEWFIEPAREDRAWVSDPYHDEGGAEIDVVTVAVPARVDARLAGVAAADLDLAGVADLALPALQRLSGPAALVTCNGMTVVSNDARRLPACEAPAVEPLAVVASPAVDWRIALFAR